MERRNGNGMVETRHKSYNTPLTLYVKQAHIKYNGTLEGRLDIDGKYFAAFTVTPACFVALYSVKTDVGTS